MRWGVILLPVALAACGGRVVPAGPGASPAPTRARASSDQPTNAQPAVVRPFPATPIAPQPVGVVPPDATSAVMAGVLAGPALASLPLDQRQVAGAVAGFRTSCNALMRRPDSSGLTRGADWQPACAAAASAGDPVRFMTDYFEAVQVGDGRATATGYYEPEIAGSRERRPGYEVPIWARPDDLAEVDLGQFSDDLKGKRIRGKVAGRGFVPYDDRAEIDRNSLDGRAKIIAWAADPVELFFLQIQGSGRLRLPDGGIMRIGYDTQNGRGYVGIGKLMLDRGLLQPGQASMQGIMAWLRANPEQGRAIMEENRSYVFFRVIGDAPLGAMGLPVIGQVSAAVDPRFIPLGAPVLLSMDRAEPNGVWIAQDTGGAIKGVNRVDTFWGAGDQARAIAGGMKARGTAWVLVPRGTYQRLLAEAGWEAAMAERPLNPEEAALWGRVVASVAPLPGRAVPPPPLKPTPPVRVERSRDTLALASGTRFSTSLETNGQFVAGGTKPATLDGTWDRRLAQGLIQPDRSIDLHGLTLDRAYGAIDATLAAAIRGGERVVLMVTGKPRPEVRTGGGAGRGAIRAVVGDWLAASRHAAAIAAVRNAHPRHGGAGALYVILRRR